MRLQGEWQDIELPGLLLLIKGQGTGWKLNDSLPYIAMSRISIELPHLAQQSFT